MTKGVVQQKKKIESEIASLKKQLKVKEQGAKPKKKRKAKSEKKVFKITSSIGGKTVMKKLVIKRAEHYVLRSSGGEICIDEVIVNNGGTLTMDPKKGVEIKKFVIAPGGILITK